MSVLLDTAVNIQSEIVEGIVVMRLFGRLTLETIHELQKAIQAMLGSGYRDYILNMVDVTDMSSSGMAKILELVRTMAAKNGRVVLSDLSAVCEYVLDLAGLTAAFAIYKTNADALAALRIPNP